MKYTIAGGNSLSDSNIWGQHILVNVQNKATYTLALSGTPWRSDNKPVTLSKYSDTDGHIVCDYEYGLDTAINENICRTPHVTVVDNDNITVESKSKGRRIYKSIGQALKDSEISYQSIIESDAVIEYCLREADNRLKKIKKSNGNAAGLVVASSIAHANKITKILTTKFNKTVHIVNYKDSESANIIEHFQHTNIEWLVSVGMVSEGTNIPRLQVCCHLTRIKTELHFRQVLGRIMRLTSLDNDKEAHLFAPAQPKLVEYAKRLTYDIPDATLASIEVGVPLILVSPSSGDSYETPNEDINGKEILAKLTPRVTVAMSESPQTMADSFFSSLLFSGRFTKKLIGH